MMKASKKILGFLIAILSFFVFAGIFTIFYARSHQQELLDKAVQFANEKISETIKTRVDIGEISVDQDRNLHAKNLAIFDRHDQNMISIGEADVELSLLSSLQTVIDAVRGKIDPLSTIENVKIKNVEINFIQRDDGSWNFNDIQSTSEEPSTFQAEVKVEDAHAKIGLIQETDSDSENIRGSTYKEIEVENISAEVSCKDLPNNLIKIKKSQAEILGAQVEAEGLVDLENSKQVASIDLKNLDAEKFLYLLPEDTLPENLIIDSAHVEKSRIDVVNRDGDVRFTGDAKYRDVSVQVNNLIADDIHGIANFSNESLRISTDLSARLENLPESESQTAHVYGTIRLDTDEPYFDLKAQSDSINPQKILDNIPVEVDAKVSAHLLGTATNPTLDGEVFIPSVEYEGISAQNISSHVRYENSAVYLSEIEAETFGGSISGEGTLRASDLAYDLHVLASEIDLTKVSNDLNITALNEASGKITADLGVHGISDDLTTLEVYGSAKTQDAQYQFLPIKSVDVSFHTQNKDLMIDYLSAELPNKSSLGIEGSITDGSQLDFNFYGGHVDLNLIEPILQKTITSGEIEPTISGLSDFRGTIKGELENPALSLEFSAVSLKHRDGTVVVKGELFKQEYDSIKMKIGGSLDELQIEDFALEKDGKDVWLAKGSVGLTGEQNLDVRIDTVGSRAEHIASLFENNPTFQDQIITGNVDNVITITGNLNDPNVVGYIHFWRGSYNGMIVSGLDGDYFVEGDFIRLQDFHVQTPMIDMVVNGTINRQTLALDFQANALDINARRFQSQFPENYLVEGHGKFQGIIQGTMEKPIFDGRVISEHSTFNGVDLDEIRGHIHYENNDVDLQEFVFKQGVGEYNLSATLENFSRIAGDIIVQDVGVKELAALANQKNDLLDGTLNATIKIANTIDNPTVVLKGEIKRGSFAEYEIHDLILDTSLQDRFLKINKCEGYQGSAVEAEKPQENLLERVRREGKIPTIATQFEGQGYFSISGSANNPLDSNGTLDFQLTARNLQLGMFASAAKIETEVIGTADIDATVTGTISNPAAKAELHAYNGGIRGSAFDNIDGEFELKDGAIIISNLVAKEQIDEKTYSASLNGILPLVALTAKSKDDLKKEEQIYLIFSVDEADLSLLPVLSKQVSWAMGEMGGKLVITGTLDNPDINGRILVTEGVTKFKLLDKPIDHMNLDVEFTDSVMKIANCTGNIGAGDYSLTGGMDLIGLELKNYNFNFTANSLDIQAPFFRGPLSMNLTLAEQSIFRGRRILPKLSGEINLDTCTISVPSLPTDDSPLPDVLLDVTLNVGNKVHLYSAYLYDMYLNGSVHFEGATNFPKSSGTISVKNGGTINYLKTSFKIKEGEANFGQVGSFFPRLNFFAETRLDQARIFIYINGNLDDMKFKLGSSPEMNETEIMQLLTFRNAYQNGESVTAADLITIGLQMSLLSEVESFMRQNLYLDQFSVSRGSGSAFENHAAETSDNNADEYNVQFGKYISDKVLLKYTQGIGGDHIHRYGVQYEFSNNFAMSIERESGEYYFGIEARIKF